MLKALSEILKSFNNVEQQQGEIRLEVQTTMRTEVRVLNTGRAEEMVP
jgi:hypothetical protein